MKRQPWQKSATNSTLKNVTKLSEVDVETCVYLDWEPKSVPPSEGGKVTTTSYIELMCKGSDPYKTLFIRDVTLTILK